MRSSFSLLTLPNLLTFLRLLIVPILAVLFYIPGESARWGVFILFFVAAVTDFFDGYLARIWHQDSPFGRMLDPIADKILVAVVLFLLVSNQTLSGLHLIPALVILCREILVSGLREFLIEMRVHIPVTRFAKWKTAFQLGALGFLLIGPVLGSASFFATLTGKIFLWCAALLTIQTGYAYFFKSFSHFSEKT